jgi:hypothetical protein
MEKLNLNEDFICRIWDEKTYYTKLVTTDNRSVEILDYGERNYDAGPDYKNARVRIEGVIFSGDIEIHRTFKDWQQHKHQKDSKYNRVILQVVFWDDEFNSEMPLAKSIRTIPTIILSKFLVRSIHEIWKEIIDNPSPKFRLPCSSLTKDINTDIKDKWLEKLAMERIENKAERIAQNIKKPIEKIFWEEALFVFICEALGYSKNKEQFLKLSSIFRFEELKTKIYNRIQLDALLFGSAGFLKELRYRDDYILKLKYEWQEIKPGLKIEAMDRSEWNFFRLRPANFPTLRIAYASALLFELLYNNLFDKIISCFEYSKKPVTETVNILNSIKVTDYWYSHYKFGGKPALIKNIIGKDRIMNIIINVIKPLLFKYGSVTRNVSLVESVIHHFKNSKYSISSNEISRVMKSQLNYRIRKVSEEQGMIQLHNFYCIKGRCNECEIGKLVFLNKVMEPLHIILY